MQYSIALVLSLAGLSVGAAIEKPASSGKLPWKEPGPIQYKCGKLSFDEEHCGTEYYCGLFDTTEFKPDDKYNNVAECMAAHDDPPPQSPVVVDEGLSEEDPEDSSEEIYEGLSGEDPEDSSKEIYEGLSGEDFEESSEKTYEGLSWEDFEESSEEIYEGLAGENFEESSEETHEGLSDEIYEGFSEEDFKKPSEESS